MTIDETIEKYTTIAHEYCDLYEDKLYFEQLTEWLKELKAYYEAWEKLKAEVNKRRSYSLDYDRGWNDANLHIGNYMYNIKPHTAPTKITLDNIFDYLDNHASPGKLTYNGNDLIIDYFHVDTQKWETICIINKNYDLSFPLLNHKVEAREMIKNCKTNKEAVETILGVVKKVYGEKLATFRKFEGMLDDVAHINKMEI